MSEERQIMICRYGRTEWRDDMKKLLKRAGLEAKQTVFLFTDTQIIHETFLEVCDTFTCSCQLQLYSPKNHNLFTNLARLLTLVAASL